MFVFIKSPYYRGAKILVRIILKGFKVHVVGTNIPLRNDVLLAKNYPIGLGKQCLAKTYPKMKYECFYKMYVYRK